MIVRAATAADIPAVADVLEASANRQHGPGCPAGRTSSTSSLGRASRSPIDDTGLAIGMAGSIEVGRPDVRFLSDLFVRPDRQDHGVGRALLAMAFDGTTERLTFSSADPRALGRTSGPACDRGGHCST